MKKKSTQTKIPTSKVILFTTIIFAVGIFILFFSFLMSTPSSETPILAENTNNERHENFELDDTPDSPPIALAPRPDVEIPGQTDSNEDALPAKTKDGVLVFVFDDGGHQVSHTQDFIDLPFDVTIAVLPQLADSVETAQLVRHSGNELFLHQPMQAINLNINPGPGAILPGMTTGEAASIVRQNLAELGKVAGINNHEGSLITSDRNLMNAVLDVCDDNDIFFLDSRTTADTVVPMLALERDIIIHDRDIFIDNEKDKAYMREMVEKGLKIADEQGYAIMIGHVTTPLLASLLDEMYDDLSSQGYTFTTPSQLRKKI